MSKPAFEIGVFSAEVLGKSLKQMPLRTIKTGVQNVTSAWYHSDRNVDLYIWKDERSNIIKQQLQFHGQIAEWNIIEGTRTGLVIEEGAETTQAIQFDQKRQPYTIDQVVDILRSINDMADLERGQLIKNFSESPNFGDLKPTEVLSLYGRPNNWRNRIMAWFDRLVFLFQFGAKR
jgi:hypothetical protein